jgi:hypothetical protein
MNAAATSSLALGKCRYSVALATFALRVTASIVTALGPPDRSNAVAASSNRARDRAGRGSLFRADNFYTTSDAGNKTIGLTPRLIVSKLSTQGE